VLSEIPVEWHRAIRSWHELNLGRKTKIADTEIPTTAEEYFFYQALTGVWPLNDPGPEEWEELVARLRAYMRKSLREAKIHSSWINPNESYEEAVDQFVRLSLEPSPENGFVREFTAFVQKIKFAGMWNSLSQTLLKIASPGVPDFYQGTEIWDFSLVDPDNRRPVDYLRRCQLLKRLRELQLRGALAVLEELTTDLTDGAIKLYVISRALCFRKSNVDLLLRGSYIPLRTTGRLQNHAIAFARALGRRSVIAAAGRFFIALGAEKTKPTGPEIWSDSALQLRRDVPHTAYRDVFSGRTVEIVEQNGRHILPLAEIFAHLPVALLESVA